MFLISILRSCFVMATRDLGPQALVLTRTISPRIGWRSRRGGRRAAGVAVEPDDGEDTGGDSEGVGEGGCGVRVGGGVEASEVGDDLCLADSG